VSVEKVRSLILLAVNESSPIEERRTAAWAAVKMIHGEGIALSGGRVAPPKPAPSPAPAPPRPRAPSAPSADYYSAGFVGDLGDFVETMQREMFDEAERAIWRAIHPGEADSKGFVRCTRCDFLHHIAKDKDHPHVVVMRREREARSQEAPPPAAAPVCICRGLLSPEKDLRGHWHWGHCPMFVPDLEKRDAEMRSEEARRNEQEKQRADAAERRYREEVAKHAKDPRAHAQEVFMRNNGTFRRR